MQTELPVPAEANRGASLVWFLVLQVCLTDFEGPASFLAIEGQQEVLETARTFLAEGR